MLMALHQIINNERKAEQMADSSADRPVKQFVYHCKQLVLNRKWLSTNCLHLFMSEWQTTSKELQG